jgi:effector-binding domain-containing protein
VWCTSAKPHSVTRMLSAPHVAQTSVRQVAAIRLNILRSEMPAYFGPAAQEIFASLAAQQVQPVGALFAHHFQMPPDRFDFELGIEVANPISAAGRVVASTLPALRVAHAIYTGPYAGLPNAWPAFRQWIASQGLKHAENLWELYAVGPQSTSNPAEYQTELFQPLVD